MKLWIRLFSCKRCGYQALTDASVNVDAPRECPIGMIDRALSAPPVGVEGALSGHGPMVYLGLYELDRAMKPAW